MQIKGLIKRNWPVDQDTNEGIDFVTKLNISYLSSRKTLRKYLRFRDSSFLK